MSFVSRGIMDYLGVTPNDPNCAKATALGLHQRAYNSVGSYFLFNLNGSYRLTNILGIKDLRSTRR
jgi:hypothetical protein